MSHTLKTNVFKTKARSSIMSKVKTKKDKEAVEAPKTKKKTAAQIKAEEAKKKKAEADKKRRAEKAKQKREEAQKKQQEETEKDAKKENASNLKIEMIKEVNSVVLLERDKLPETVCIVNVIPGWKKLVTSPDNQVYDTPFAEPILIEDPDHVLFVLNQRKRNHDLFFYGIYADVPEESQIKAKFEEAQSKRNSYHESYEHYVIRENPDKAQKMGYTDTETDIERETTTSS